MIPWCRGALAVILASAALLGACGSGGGGGAKATPTPTSRPRPVVSISPDHGKAGTVVIIKGSGFMPGSNLRASICAVDAKGNVPNYFFDCDLGNTVPAKADSGGYVALRFTVKSIPHAISGGGYHIGLGPLTGPDPSNDGGAEFSVDP